jgi:hypothetical protein
MDDPVEAQRRTPRREAQASRLRRATTVVAGAAVVFTGVFAGLAASASSHAKKATRAVTTTEAADESPSPSTPAPAAPAQAPVQTQAPPVVSSGGS